MNKVNIIIYWWDKTTRSWIVQAKDADGNQVGPAEYAANTRTLPSAIALMQRQYPEVKAIRD